MPPPFRPANPLCSSLLPRVLPLFHPRFATPGKMGPVNSHLVNAATTTPVKNVMVSTHVSIVHFLPQSPQLSVHCHFLPPEASTNVSDKGLQDPFRGDLVNSVNTSCYCSDTDVLFPVNVTVISSLIETEPYGSSSSVNSGFPGQVTSPHCPFIKDNPHQDLVTPINVYKLWQELHHHPNQEQVSYVMSGLHNGFHLGFNQALVSLKSVSQTCHQHHSILW